MCVYILDSINGCTVYPCFKNFSNENLNSEKNKSFSIIGK